MDSTRCIIKNNATLRSVRHGGNAECNHHGHRPHQNDPGPKAAKGDGEFDQRTIVTRHRAIRRPRSLCRLRSDVGRSPGSFSTFVLGASPVRPVLAAGAFRGSCPRPDPRLRAPRPPPPSPFDIDNAQSRIGTVPPRDLQVHRFGSTRRRSTRHRSTPYHPPCSRPIRRAQSPIPNFNHAIASNCLYMFAQLFIHNYLRKYRSGSKPPARG
jgi:hypothetical protein